MPRNGLSSPDKADFTEDFVHARNALNIFNALLVRQDCQVVFAGQGIDSGPAEVGFRPPMWMAGDGGDQDTHFCDGFISTSVTVTNYFASVDGWRQDSCNAGSRWEKPPRDGYSGRPHEWYSPVGTTMSWAIHSSD